MLMSASEKKILDIHLWCLNHSEVEEKKKIKLKKTNPTSYA